MNIDKIIEEYSCLTQHTIIQPFGDGHINDTFLITTNDAKYILQRVNNSVFDTPVLISNLLFLFGALSGYEKRANVKLTPAIIKNNNGDFHTLDYNGAAWRLMEFFQQCQSYAISPDVSISYRAAQAIGKFQLFLNTLPVNRFRNTINDFHNTPKRLEIFLNTLKTASETLKQQAQDEIRFVKQHHYIACELEELFNTNKLTQRVTHNDTKLDNILFTANNQVIIIDLDTVMPGYIMYDFGDMVRTFTSPAKEDEPEINKISFRIEHFEALTKGYLEQLKDHITEIEKQNLLLGVKAIIYEQTLRFLNDFLLGNIYYKVNYPTHNLVRTRTQIILLQNIINNENELLKIIDKSL